MDKLRAAHAAWARGDTDSEARLGETEYQRRRGEARRRGRRWPATPAPSPARPPIGPRMPGDPTWTDAELRDAHRIYDKRRMAGLPIPSDIRDRERFFNTLHRRRRRRELAAAAADAKLQPRTLRRIEAVEAVLEYGGTLAAAAARVEWPDGRPKNPEDTLARWLQRQGPRGVRALHQMSRNAAGSELAGVA